MRKFLWTIILAIFISAYAAPLLNSEKADAEPLIANYFLGPLPTDQKSIDLFSKSQLLIFTPDQIALHKDIIDQIKKKNPSIIVLAYVPSQSYNVQYWGNDYIFRNMHVQDSWWLKDTNGRIRTPWPGLQLTNMTQGWSEYLVGFVKQYIETIPNVDGIFFDMVSDGILNTDLSTVDLDGDGQPDGANNVVHEWVNRTAYLLQYARANLKVPYIVINGSSNSLLQQSVNGRMFESFPTPWESGGSWSAIMGAIQRNKSLNSPPPIYILNSNSNNTGKQNDYQKVRFGLASSLMSDNVYFGYDYGDMSHNQVWWYDEYDARLGDPTGQAQSLNGRTQFQNDVWRRDFTNGIVLVNPTNQDQDVDLGGDYEKIIGTQDTTVNNGAIVSTVHLPAHDGLIMYKTFKTVQGTFFPNGTFLRFYKPDGSRARNGFFAFESGRQGGERVYNGDLDGDGQADKIVLSGNHMQIMNSLGAVWYDGYPYGDTYKGELSVGVGHVVNNNEMDLVVAPSKGGRVMIMSYLGQVVRDNIYPLGKKYTGGLSVAVGDTDGNGVPEVMIGVWPGQAGKVMVYDNTITKLKTTFYPYGTTWKGGIKLTAGDFNGDGKYEIATLQGSGRSLTVRFFDGKGKKLNGFVLKGFFGEQRFTLGAADVNHEGNDELLVMSGN